MYRALAFAVLLTSLIACSSGSSNGRSQNNPDGPQKPTPDGGAAFILGGNVSGLSGGQLILSNGIDNDFAVVNANGIFAFPKKIPSGQLYNVRVESRPSDQICEVGNSKNFLIRDTADIRVYCARAVVRPVQFTRPVNLNLNKLVLSSNYQRINASTSPAIQEAGNSLQVFDHSYVALSVVPFNGTEPEPIFLAHVHDMGEYLSAPDANKKPVYLDVDSTIEALLLLEPTIATAILERVPNKNLLPALLDSIMTVAELTPEYKNLSDKIHSLIAAQKTLLSHGGELNEPLHALVQRVAVELLGFPYPIPPVNETVPGLGVKIDAIRGVSDLTINFSNSASRTVAVHSTAFNPFFLGENATPITIPGGVPAQQSLPITLNGPGSFGEVSEARKNAYVEAVIRSGAEQHFFPSLNLMLGLLDPIVFDLDDCLQNEYSAAINSMQSSAGTTALSRDYSATYNRVFDLFRSRFIGTSADQKLLQEMFACEKFGVGSYIETQDKLNIAKGQVQSVLKVAKAAYDSANNPLDLFAHEALTRLTATIAKTAVETVWVYSNELALKVVADPPIAAPGTPIKMQASCSEPSGEKIVTSCDISWDFGNGIVRPTKNFPNGLSEESYTYSEEGSYTVTVTAARPSGVEVSQKITVSVRLPKAKISVTEIDGTILSDGTGAIDFGQVLVGTSTTTTELEITNIGTAPLLIDDIISTDNAFSISPTEFSISPAQSRRVQIRFAPTAAQQYSAMLDIVNNDADPQKQVYRIQLKGQGYLEGKPANGGWTVVQNGMENSFVVQRAKVDFLQEGRLAIRIFGSSTGEFPQILINLPGYKPGQSATYKLDDTGTSGCNGSFILSSAENGYCTSTNPAVSMPITGTVQVTVMDNGQRTLHYDFNAALNSIACGKLDVSLCEIISVDGTASFNTTF